MEPPTTPRTTRDPRAYLQTLPAELLLAISHELPTPSVGALRLACRATDAALAQTYRKDHFTRLQALVSLAGLAALAGIAARPELACNVKEIALTPDIADGAAGEEQYALLGLLDHVRRDGRKETNSSPPPPWPCPATLSLAYELADVLRTLPSIDCLIVGAFYSHSIGRPADIDVFRAAHREGGAVLKPLGCSALSPGTEVRRDTRTINSMFRALLLALALSHTDRAKAGYRGVKNLEIRQSSRVDDEVFDLGDAIGPLLAPALADLSDLHLNLVNRDDYSATINFMRLCHNVQTFSLGSGGYSLVRPSANEQGPLHILNWLAGNNDGPPFPKLEHLVIFGGPQVPVTLLSKILVQFPKLWRAELICIDLVPGELMIDESCRWPGYLVRHLLRTLSRHHQEAPLPIRALCLSHVHEPLALEVRDLYIPFVNDGLVHQNVAIVSDVDECVRFPNVEQVPLVQDHREIEADDMFDRLSKAIKDPSYVPEPSYVLDPLRQRLQEELDWLSEAIKHPGCDPELVEDE
ncbi:hypothetical protein Q8F55_008507 [Vanrija albida]|uniref:F-box domain-containing protein n=1 Tax=Vanrija albida TaxID=181172 RepID=A0ABR3PRD6_9TREE